MGKEANLMKKSSKTPVILCRVFLKIAMGFAILSVFAISAGNSVRGMAAPITFSIFAVVAYELTYFLYKFNFSSTREKLKRDVMQSQINILLKMILFYMGFAVMVIGAINYRDSKNALFILLMVAGAASCQLLHNNKRIFSHLSTFCENAAFGTLLSGFYSVAKLGLKAKNLLFLGIIFILILLQEVFFHFYNIRKHKGGEQYNKINLIKERGKIFFRDFLVVVILCIIWSALVYIGTLEALDGGNLYEKATKLMPIGLSMITVSILLYNNFLKKQKVERLNFQFDIDKDEFIEKLREDYGTDSKALKAADYVMEEMNAKKGYRRYSGEDYYVHPLGVAKILMDEVKADDETVTVALLHDCIEDLPECNYDKIQAEYGERVADRVKLLTKIQGVDYKEYANMKEYLDKISENYVASLVKIADRMNNNSTMTNSSDAKKENKYKETKKYYLPFIDSLRKKNSGISEEFLELAEAFFKQEIE